MGKGGIKLPTVETSGQEFIGNGISSGKSTSSGKGKRCRKDLERGSAQSGDNGEGGGGDKIPGEAKNPKKSLENS